MYCIYTCMYLVTSDHDDDVKLGLASLSAEDGEGRGGSARGGGQRPATARFVGVGHVVVGADLCVGHNAWVWEGRKEVTRPIIFLGLHNMTTY